MSDRDVDREVKRDMERDDMDEMRERLAWAMALLREARQIDAPNDTDNRLLVSVPLLPDDLCRKIDAFLEGGK